MIPLVKIITGFFSTGYALYCAKATMKGSKNLPKWDNWGDIFLKGLLARIIVLIYHLPVLLFGIFLIFSLGGMAILTELRQSPAMAVKTLLGLGTGILLMLCLAVLINYLVPSALMSYVDKNSFGAAFNLGNVFKNAFRGEYFITWLFFILYAVGIGIIAVLVSLILAITIIGPVIIMGYVLMIGQITSFTMFAQAYKKK